MDDASSLWQGRAILDQAFLKSNLRTNRPQLSLRWFEMMNCRKKIGEALDDGHL